MCKDCVILYQVTCVPKAILGRYVTVHVHTATQYLGLSEVEVYGRVGEYAAHIHSCAGHNTLYKKNQTKRHGINLCEANRYMKGIGKNDKYWYQFAHTW